MAVRFFIRDMISRPLLPTEDRLMDATALLWRHVARRQRRMEAVTQQNGDRLAAVEESPRREVAMANERLLESEHESSVDEYDIFE